MKKQIDRFVLKQVVSESSNGTVYQADELLPGNLKRPVAFKILPSITPNDPKAEQRFLEGVKLLVALGSHPNIVSVYGMGVTDQLPWLAMEWIPATLAQAARDVPTAPEHVASMMRQVATALSALHGLTPPVLHNDITPANILVDQFGNYKITDFSLASPAAVERTRVLATVRYAAPELLSGEFGPLTPATDLYALGHIAYEMALTADPIDADRAYELGLVNRVVPGDEVLDAAVALAERIAQNAPLAVRVSKDVMRTSLEMTELESWELNNSSFGMIARSADALEGAVAFAEKRPPQWQGK